MTESIQELLEYVNSAVDWYPHEDEVIEIAPSVFPEIQDDPIPVMVVTYYPVCDCGEQVLLRIVPMVYGSGNESFSFVGSEYMDTCYECGVISSD